MYLQALKDGIPFFEWPKWIEKKLDRVYLDFIYKKKQTSAKMVNPKHVYLRFNVVEGYNCQQSSGKELQDHSQLFQMIKHLILN